MQNRLRGLILALALLLAAIAAYFLLPIRQDHQVTETGTALIGGPFTMVNHKGKTVSERDFAGKYMLVFFGFTHCEDVCPTTLNVMTAAMQQLGLDADKITPIFVSIDPDRDTPRVMSDYVKAFDPRTVGLTGSPEQVAAMAKSFHVYYKKVPNKNDPTDYEMDHTSIIYLMGMNGAFVKHYNYTTDANGLADDLKKVIRG